VGHAPRSARALYRFDGAGKPHITALPRMQEINGLWLNFDDPDFALVQVSATYAVPLLAPRRD